MAHSLPLSKRHNGPRAESIHTWALPSASTGSLEFERSGEPFIDRFLASAWAQIEKALTTPDQYPLSLNSLTNACNQKSNQEPILSLDESTVQETVDALVKKHMITEASGFGSRVSKIQHRFCNTEFGKLKLTEQELGIICVLFLRGPQTPGEMRTRTNRLCRFSDVSEVDSCLNELKRREDGPFVVRLEREPGKRDSRFAHLLSGDIDPAIIASTIPGTAVNSPETSSPDRIDALEAMAFQLQNEVKELKEKLADLLN